MELSIQSPYTEYIQKIIDFGIADSPAEAVKQSLFNFIKQIEFEEIYLVDKAVRKELEDIENSNERLFSLDEVIGTIEL
ncbi:MAG: hypothetical protein NT007_02820 [Candidatus Kapabacteria bacterium]|nr:hypothetical protein [Candidatus Kapabacteria bacterium]